MCCSGWAWGAGGLLGLNSDRYRETVFAARWGGGVFNIVNIRWSAAEIAYFLDDCDTRILFVDDEFVPLASKVREKSSALQTVVYMGGNQAPEGTEDLCKLMEDAFPVTDAGRYGDDLAAILYTGGTTGKPKGVMLSQANLYLNAMSTVIPACRRDRIVGLHSVMPFS